MNTGIYSITCKVNEKIYIGYSNDIKGRWGDHKYELKKDVVRIEQEFIKIHTYNMLGINMVRKGLNLKEWKYVNYQNFVNVNIIGPHC